ncbi:MAG: Rieske (2Fe-2S) protein [Acidimicrobiales bacterium]
MSPTTSPPTRSFQKTARAQIDKIGQLTALDPVGDRLDKLVRPRLEPAPVRNALSGVWLGHRLHPLLTDIAIGSLTSATLVDFLAPRHPHVARRLIGVGLLAALPTAASGLSDWMDVYDDGRRVGLVHAAGNTIAMGLFARSFLHRGHIHKARGAKGRGRLSALAGLAVLSVTGYLGGHLSYVQGVGVDHTGFQPRVEEWSDVAAVDEVTEGGPAVVRAGEVEILLVRQDGELRALANRCSHAGWPLAPGKFEAGCVTCPMHGSVFRIEDGAVQKGPAASPQPMYQVREKDGRIEVRS